MVQKFDWAELEQLAMALDVEEVEVDKTAPSYAEIQARSAKALQVLENTGFELLLADEITVNDPPSQEELRILREDVDKDKFYNFKDFWN